MIRTITLKSIVKKHGISNGVLKTNCECREYDVIVNETNALRSFGILKIEYSEHLRNYTVDQLTKPLEDIGFRCRIYAHNDIAARMGLRRHGTIMCIK